MLFRSKQKVKEAEQFAEEDKRRKEEVETRNRAETLIYETEKSMKEIDSNLSEEEKTRINNAKEDLARVMENGTVEDIKAKTDALTEEFHTISSKMYQQAQSSQGGQDGFDPGNMGGSGGNETGGSAENDDNVVDADYEVVDEEKTE